ncbi:glycosyltransferase involved in cell wall biosynthesis [Pedobacter sp. UYP30]|uniref:glycosyltransferase family 2 protein n=1 Tax=Pedobacter sp. UYP30 TaxID=1756400 RepID=UPI003391DFF9
MNEKLPLISVCIPAYNSAQYIVQTITCICVQSYSNIEIIVVNDGSQDQTEEFLESIKDERLKIFNIPNSGACKARNFAYEKANGDFIVFFDADDYVMPNFIATQYDAIRKDLNSVVFSGWGRFHNNDLTTLKIEETPRETFTFLKWINTYWYNTKSMTNPGRALIPRNLLEIAGLWNEELSLNDDFEFFTRIFKTSEKIIFNNESYLFYRSGLDSLSNKKDLIGYKSYYSSTLKGIEYALESFKGDSDVEKSCANLLQLFVYSSYPTYPELVMKSEKLIQQLGGSDLPFPSGKITNLITKIIGWKYAKRIRSAI